MRPSLSLAAVAALAAGALGLQAATAVTQAAPSQRTITSTDSASALRALKAHPGDALTSRGTDFVVTGRVVDPDGSIHVRLDRTYRGLPVLGGDLVVHLGPDGAWRGASQTLRAPVRVGAGPHLSAQQARSVAVAPTRLTRSISSFKAAGTPRLVVDATSGRARLAWRVASLGRHADGTPSRLATYVDARTGARAAPRGAHPDRRRLRPVAVQRGGPAAADAVGLDVPAQGPDPGQHLHDRPEQQDRLALAASSSASAARPARCSPAPTPCSATARPAAASPRPSTRSTART